MLARHATGFASGAGSPKSPAPLFAEIRGGGVRCAITMPPSRSRRSRGICARWRNRWFCRVEDAHTRFAGVNFVTIGTTNVLVVVRKQAHATAAALFIHGFGERDAVVAFRCPRVRIENFFRNLRGD